MKNIIVGFFFIISIAVLLLCQMGCETPEGGSSIPWGRPEPWEGEGTIGIPIS